ncbi:hypothetical protein PIB30_041833 [Stylosanthes scabra]|uniref:Uncharacterized protein n=1 Tax=Stylosanthes scabra TaxID=79078 RepID=A0ABU6RFP2_9FABA|nr:hypothetical protein [Stylosanthes scabra]
MVILLCSRIRILEDLHYVDFGYQEDKGFVSRENALNWGPRNLASIKLLGVQVVKNMLFKGLMEETLLILESQVLNYENHKTCITHLNYVPKPFTLHFSYLFPFSLVAADPLPPLLFHLHGRSTAIEQPHMSSLSSTVPFLPTHRRNCCILYPLTQVSFFVFSTPTIATTALTLSRLPPSSVVFSLHHPTCVEPPLSQRLTLAVVLFGSTFLHSAHFNHRGAIARTVMSSIAGFPF